MSKIIPFTQKHEKLLKNCHQQLKVHGRALEKHGALLEKHAKSIQDLSEETHRLGLLMEDQKSTLQTVLEVVTHINKRFTPQDDMEQKIENHEHRISAVESHLRPSG